MYVHVRVSVGPDIRRNNCVFNSLLSRWWMIILEMIKRRVSSIRMCACQSNVMLTLTKAVRESDTRVQLRHVRVMCCVFNVYEVSLPLYACISVSASAHHSITVRACVWESVCSHPCVRVWSSQRAVQLWLWLYDGHLEAKLVNGASKPTASRPSPCWVVWVCVCMCVRLQQGLRYIWPAVLPQTNTPAEHLGAFPSNFF